MALGKQALYSQVAGNACPRTRSRGFLFAYHYFYFRGALWALFAKNIEKVKIEVFRPMMGFSEHKADIYRLHTRVKSRARIPFISQKRKT